MPRASAELRIEITESAGVQDKVPIAIVPFAEEATGLEIDVAQICLLYTSPSPRDATLSRMPSSA